MLLAEEFLYGLGIVLPADMDMPTIRSMNKFAYIAELPKTVLEGEKNMTYQEIVETWDCLRVWPINTDSLEQNNTVSVLYTQYNNRFNYTKIPLKRFILVGLFKPEYSDKLSNFEAKLLDNPFVEPKADVFLRLYQQQCKLLSSALQHSLPKNQSMKIKLKVC